VAVASTDTIVEPRHIADRLGTKRLQSPVRSRASEPPGDDERATPPAKAAGFRRLAEEVAELERRRMIEALAASNGNHAQAARLLGVPVRTFFAKVKKYKIAP
jgi:transcriptional regulator with GAF, ATPase, and Fis domain